MRSADFLRLLLWDECDDGGGQWWWSSYLPHQLTGRRDLVRTAFLSLEDMVRKSISNQVNPFSFSTSFRSRGEKTILGWRWMLQSLTSFVCCTNIATTAPPSWKSAFKKDHCCSQGLQMLMFTLYCLTQTTDWPSLFPVFVVLLLLLAPHCCEDLPSCVYEPSPNTS